MIPVLLLLLLIPVFSTTYFSLLTDWSWLILASCGLVAATLLLLKLLAKIPDLTLRRILGIPLFFIVSFFLLARLVSFYVQGESFNERFFFHFTIDTLSQAGGAFVPLQVMCAIVFVLVGVLVWRVLRNPELPVFLTPSWVTIGLLFLFLAEPDVYRFGNWEWRYILNSNQNLSLETIAWADLNLNQEALDEITQPVTPGKNLVIVYLESLEQIYLEESLFPGLTPNLARLSEEGLSLTNLTQTEGTAWTVAGILSSQCSTPLVYEYGPRRNDILQGGFLNEAVCLGDILDAAGYNQVYFGGASTLFGGKGRFLSTHGYDEVHGLEDLQPLLAEQEYTNNWGLYDDSLFEFVTPKFDELAESGDPFNLTVLTLDTHHPYGHRSENCPEYTAIDNSILQAVHCDDYLVGQFVEHMKQSPVWDDTIVLLMSDHLAMRSIVQNYYPEDYDRKLYFTVLNSGTQKRIDEKVAHTDVAPTLLNLMGVEHQHKFLGGVDILNTDVVALQRDFDNRARVDALKYLNTRVLTALQESVCAADTLFEVTDKRRLLISGNDRGVSIGGRDQDISILNETHGYVVVIDNDGLIKATITAKLDNLGNLLYEYKDDNYLLIANEMYLPGFARTGQETPGELAVILGTVKGDSYYLGSQDYIENVNVKPGDCGSLLEEVVASINPDNPDPLLEICESDTNAMPNYVNLDNGNLQLDRVFADNNWFAAVLEKVDDFTYQLIEQKHLGGGSTLASPDTCHTYYSNEKVIIPALNLNGQKRAMYLNEIEGDSLTFRVVEYL